MAHKDDLPTYGDLMYPVLKAVADLGGSAQARQITDRVVEELAFPDDVVSITYATREKSVLVDRLDWARSYCKLAEVLESPARGVFLITPLGRAVLELDEQAARQRLAELDHEVRARRRVRSEPGAVELAEIDDADDEWKEAMLARLHRMSPHGFEEFVLFLLRAYGLELTRRGGPGDEGVDGIGTAPLGPVLSSTVAVQIKRHDPASSVPREVVALFQRDASAAGAERAILVTLGRFTEPARKAAITTKPTVDLIDGNRLCDLVRDRDLPGVRRRYQVIDSWFDRFDT